LATHSSSSLSSLSSSASVPTGGRPPAKSALALKAATLANAACKLDSMLTSCASNQAHKP
jgi:hypothetical protein